MIKFNFHNGSVLLNGTTSVTLQSGLLSIFLKKNKEEPERTESARLLSGNCQGNNEVNLAMTFGCYSVVVNVLYSFFISNRTFQMQLK